MNIKMKHKVVRVPNKKTLILEKELDKYGSECWILCHMDLRNNRKEWLFVFRKGSYE